LAGLLSDRSTIAEDVYDWTINDASSG
jgi:hypothetical protein